MLAQTGFAAVSVTTPAALVPLLVGIFVTDADGTIVALSLDVKPRNASSDVKTELVLPAEAAEQPQRLTPHALVKGHGEKRPSSGLATCTVIDGAGMDNWKARVESFDYKAAGGAHAAMKGMAGPSEEVLASSVPRVSMSADGALLSVSMAQHPSLFIPLLYLKCASTNVVGFYTFTRSQWPSLPRTAAEPKEAAQPKEAELSEIALEIASSPSPGAVPAVPAVPHAAATLPLRSTRGRAVTAVGFACVMPPSRSCGGFRSVAPSSTCYLLW